MRPTILQSLRLDSKLFLRKSVDDIVYEVDCQMITIKEGAIDIGSLPIFDLPCGKRSQCRFLGGNPSAEEQEEELEEGASTVNNVVHSFRLQSTQYDKKSYLQHLKVGLIGYGRTSKLILGVGIHEGHQGEAP